ncbi:uncharacterized protein LOC122647373 [Telopea speciosissima]|uniref:uncharacterized protein LOC122647373 n=1 Tax=Telopea speciosissima TaxID=54955 RepID=UPI001CC46D86|nr:uncharacterized protein LOC122647373 [Telopea speciosissima]
MLLFHFLQIFFSNEIDPSTYSFTSALKALQARSGYGYGRECLSPNGFALNSKWSEAEKYIYNPLSGEFPMECLSTKTLSGRSFPTLTSRFTVSGPLVYSYHARLAQTKPAITHEDETKFPNQDKKIENMNTIDAGTQSTPPEFSSSSPSPASTPSIKERALKQCGIESQLIPVQNPNQRKIRSHVNLGEDLNELNSNEKEGHGPEPQVQEPPPQPAVHAASSSGTAPSGSDIDRILAALGQMSTSMAQGFEGVNTRLDASDRRMESFEQQMEDLHSYLHDEGTEDEPSSDDEMEQ